MSIYEHQFWSVINEFRDLQQNKRPQAKSPWHRKDSRGMGAMNQHQVAKRYQGRYTGDKQFTRSGELNSKIELVRSGQAKMQVLSKADIRHILKSYSTKELPRDKPKRIFAGVIVYWDHKRGAYILRANG